MTDRRQFITGIATVSTVGIAGCAEPEEEEETEPEEEAEAQDEGDESDTEQQQDADIDIQAIEAPDTVELGSTFDVDVTIVANQEGSVIVEAVDEEGEITDTGEQSVSLSPTLSFNPTTGEGTIRVRVETDSGGQEDATQFEIITPPEDWEKPLQEARESLGRFFDTFAAVGSESEDRTILDTTITDDYSIEGTGELAEADNQAQEALGEATGEQDIREDIRQLRREISFCQDLTDLQGDICEIWPLLEDDLESIQDESTPSEDIDGKYNDVDEHYEDVSEELDEFEPTIGELYGEKIAQIKGELDIVDRMINAITAIGSARENYDAEFYGTAFDRAQSARRDFGNIARDLDRENHYPPDDAINETFRNHVEEWQAEADKLEREAQDRETDY